MIKNLFQYVMIAALTVAGLSFSSCGDLIGSEDLQNGLSQNREELMAELGKQSSELKSAIEQSLKEAEKYADDAMKSAKEYADATAALKADQAKADAVFEANNYTDKAIQTVLAQILSEIDGLTDTAIKASKDYTDARIEESLATAKAELLTEIDTKLTETLTNANKYTDEQIQALKDDVIAAINGRIDEMQTQVDGIDSYAKGLGTSVDSLKTDLKDLTSDFNAFKESMQGVDQQLTDINAEIDELQQGMGDLKNDLKTKYEEMQNTVQGISGKVDGISRELTTQVARLDAAIAQINATLEQHGSDIEALKASVADFTQTIEELQTALQKLIDRITDVETMISDRLTGISYISDFHIDGFPTKKMHNIVYRPIIIGEDESITYEEGDVSSNGVAETMRFRLSPSGVTEAGIKSAEFLVEGAEFAQTKAAMENDLIEIVDKGFAEGTDEYVVTVTRMPSASISSRPADQTPTVALKLVIADELLTEAEKAAGKQPYVVSQYIRLMDVEIPVNIRNSLNEEMYHATYAAAKSAETDHLVDHSSEIDLTEYISAEIDGKMLSAQQLKTIGYDMRFAIPADQQYVQFKPESTTSVIACGEDSMGKDIIIRAELVEQTSGKIIGVAWCKFRWVFAGADLGVVKRFSYTLGCEPSTSIMTFQEFSDAVLAKVGKTGITKEFFETNYQQGIHTSDLGYLNIDYTNDVAYFYLMIAYNHIGTVINHDKDIVHPSKEIQITMNPNPAMTASMQPIRFKVALDIQLPAEMPEMAGFKPSAFWRVENRLAGVTPVPYGGALETVGYEFHLNELLLDQDGSFIKNLIGKSSPSTICRTWDIHFSETQPVSGYIPRNDSHHLVDAKNANTVRLAFYFDGDLNEKIWYSHTTTDVRLYLENNEGGRNLLNAKDEAEPKQISVKLMASLNNMNRFRTGDFNVFFIEPLIIPQPTVAENVFTAENGHSVSVKTAYDALTAFDGTPVAMYPEPGSEAEKIWKYYGAPTATWHVDNAIVSYINNSGIPELNRDLDPNNEEDLMRMQLLANSPATQGHSLTFDEETKSIRFSAGPQGIAEEFDIWVFANFKHTWGVSQRWVKFTVKPATL